jgi:hypothetical protein
VAGKDGTVAINITERGGERERERETETERETEREGERESERERAGERESDPTEKAYYAYIRKTVKT